MDFELTDQNFPEKNKLKAQITFYITLGNLLLVLLIALYFPKFYFFFFFIGIFITLKAFYSYRKRIKNRGKIKIQEDRFIYFHNDQMILSFSIQSIERSSYQEGLAIEIKKPLSGKIKLHCTRFSYSTFFTKSKSKNCDLYFPGFSHSDCKKLLFLSVR